MRRSLARGLSHPTEGRGFCGILGLALPGSVLRPLGVAASVAAPPPCPPVARPPPRPARLGSSQCREVGARGRGAE